MIEDSGKNLCLFHILDGLRQGLSQFSGPSRAALIYLGKPGDPVRVYDPQDLLRGHEPKLEEVYRNSFSSRLFPTEDLELSGLISYGGTSHAIFHQMWFTEHHPDMCSTGPTKRWLEHAISLLSLGFTFKDPVFITTSSYALREYSIHAVRDHIFDELRFMFGWDAKVFVFPILDAILGISKTREEGARPWGKLAFISPEDLSEIQFLVSFPRQERPNLKNFKHVRKLLQAVEHSERALISFGNTIVGIATGKLPKRRSTADFLGEYGFIRLGGKPVCSFSNGKTYSSTQLANLVHLEEALLDSHMDISVSHDLFRIVSSIVHEAGNQKHGCTLVIDLNETPLEFPGQQMGKPLDLRQDHLLKLAKSLSKVDGALHIGSDLNLHGFACLLDGRAIKGENRARGARYNSALRFTAEHDNLIVVVVSCDRPVSVIKDGSELAAQHDWASFSKPNTLPPTLEEWVGGKQQK